MSDAMTDRKRILHITEGNLRQNHLYVKAHYDFFSKSGFRAELVALAEATPDRYRLVAPDDLLDEPYGS